MILITTRPGDETTERLIAFARERGVAARAVCRWQEVDLSVTAARNGATSVDMRIAGQDELVSGILNRLQPAPRDSSPDEQFLASEGIAAWWPALAAFHGPVVNRPSATTFLPTVAALSRQPPHSGADPARERRFLGASHRRHDRIKCGSAGADASPGTRIGRAILAGCRAIPLDDIACPDDIRLSSTDPLFAVVTLARNHGSTVVVAFNPIPTLREYAHLTDQVFAALLETLDT